MLSLTEATVENNLFCKTAVMLTDFRARVAVDGRGEVLGSLRLETEETMMWTGFPCAFIFDVGVRL